MANHPIRAAVCARCGAEYTAHNNAQRYCSRPCFAAARRDRQSRTYHADPNKFRRRVRLARYGLSDESYEELKRKAGGLCEICGQPEAKPDGLVIDHDHVTGQVRGLLCNRCHVGLHMHEDESLVAAADAYLLERSRGR